MSLAWEERTLREATTIWSQSRSVIFAISDFTNSNLTEYLGSSPTGNAAEMGAANSGVCGSRSDSVRSVSLMGKSSAEEVGKKGDTDLTESDLLPQTPELA